MPKEKVSRVPLHLEVPLEGFTARLRLPLDMSLLEAQSVARALFSHAIDPSEAAKYAVSDPNVYPEIVE
jgi:hypothetical protein